MPRRHFLHRGGALLLAVAALLLAVAALLLAVAAIGGSDAAPAAAPVEADPVAIDRSHGLSRDARVELYRSMVREARAPRHPADAGGRAWIEAVQDATGAAHDPRAGDRVRIRLVYEAGPRGVAAAGGVRFRVSPWWDWDPPQAADPQAPGYTTVAPPVPGVRPWLRGNNQGLTVSFPERGLAPGERIGFVYGAGPALAGVDRYAERGERLWFAVDGDGDGVFHSLADLPRIDVLPGPARRLRLVGPSSARPGQTLHFRVSALDARGDPARDFRGRIRLESSGGLALPEAVELGAEHRGTRGFEARAGSAGVVRVRAHCAADSDRPALRAESNPLLVEPGLPALYWADLHGHSQLSDGSGPPDDWYAYARDVSRLDAAALTDHDHWGLAFLDAEPALWRELRAAAARFHAPGRFVTLLGYEWTSLLHGHRHVLYFGSEGEVFSAFDARFQTPAQLWQALRGRPALSFAHHSAGGPLSTNWRYAPDPELEPVTEIVSSHGNSESPEAPHPIYDAVAGNFVGDALAAGARLGFIGGGDSHDGHPGVGHGDTPLGFGLAALWSESLTREGLRDALRARRVYASNGARILLQVWVDGAPMGSVLPARRGGSALRLRAVAESPLDRLELVSRAGVTRVPLEGALEVEIERALGELAAGEAHYVRVVQRDGGAAWSSPVFVE